MSFRYMIGIPALFGAGHTKEAIESVVNKHDVHLLLIDNGAEQSVKDVINFYDVLPNVSVIHNEVNNYVNAAWSQILEFFLQSECDYLMIMNSDLILQNQWKEVLDYTLKDYPYLIPVPIITSDRGILGQTVSLETEMSELFDGIAGVLIIVNKIMAAKVCPIPSEIRVWYGDNWCYDKLRKEGYHTMVLNNLLTYHSGSQNVSRVAGISEIIEQDKLAWIELNK